MKEYNVFDGFYGFLTFLFFMLTLLSLSFAISKDHEKQSEQLEEISTKIEILTQSVDSLECILYD